jgi:hypothetical protein
MPLLSPSGASWRFAAASAAGTSHVRDGLACQDAYRCGVAATPAGPVLVVVVSDGAGSASEGARASRYVCDELLDHLLPAASDVTASIAIEWLRDGIAQTRDGLLTEAESSGKPPREFAATLLCAVLAEQWSGFAQIGDGAIVTPEAGTNTWAWLFWPQQGEYANTTFFLTDATAMNNLQLDTLTNGQEEVAIFTDGLQHLVLHYEEQVVHSPFFERMMAPIRTSKAEGLDLSLSRELEKYLATSTVSSRTDDDVTLVMASRLTYT